MQIDTTTEFGQRTEQRLRDERIIWLTTVRADGQPVPVPIWFLWDGGEELLMYSRPDTPKLRNVAARPRVGLNLNADYYGGNVVQFDGDARVDHDAPPVYENTDYVSKYRDGLESFGATPEEFAAEFSVPLRVRLTRLRGF